MSSQVLIQQVAYRILMPLVKVCLRFGLSAGAMNELVRRAYVDAAEQSLVEAGKKSHTSRICALTGFYRKEVVRIKELPPLDSGEIEERYNRSSRVVAGWLRDKRFTTKSGKPRVLSLQGESGFNDLVRTHSGDMTPRAMLDELLRLKIVEMSQKNTVRLTSRGFIPQDDDAAALQILGADTADLIACIDHNIGCGIEERRFQRKVMYLHIPERHVSSFRLYAASESQKLLEKLDRWLASHDTEPRSQGKPGSRLGLGIYMIDSANEPAATRDSDAGH